MTQDHRLFAPATQRNRDPILQILRRVLPPRGTVVEIASGTGEHALHFSSLLPDIHWQPTDISEEARASIAAWSNDRTHPNLLPPLPLDAASPEDWPVTIADAIVAINMIHIAPWRATIGLLAGAARIMPPGAPLILYGPFLESGKHTAPSNADFDADLKRRNPEWGVRDLGDVVAVAQEHHFYLDERVSLPANNLIVVMRRKEAVLF